MKMRRAEIAKPDAATRTHRRIGHGDSRILCLDDKRWCAEGPGLIDDLPISTVNELFIQTQPAYLQKIQGTELGVEERNMARASYLRSRLAQANGRRTVIALCVSKTRITDGLIGAGLAAAQVSTNIETVLTLNPDHGPIR